MDRYLRLIPLRVEGYNDKLYDQLVKRPYFLYIFLVEGEELLEINEQNYLIGPGQLLLIPDNSWVRVQHFKDCKGFGGAFDLGSLKDASYPVLRSGKPILQSFWFDDAVFMAALFQRMLVAFEDKDKAFLQSGLDLMLGQLRGCTQVAAIPEEFLQMVFNRDQAPLTVADYAAQLKVTANYLNKTVKNHTHRTAIDWIEIARVNMAKQLLRDRSLSIAGIAEKTGLVDQSYFSRFFKKKTGLTPSEYRSSL